jgi:hypothetical protein
MMVSVRLHVCVVLLGGTLGCGSDLTLPDTGGSSETIVAFTAVTGTQSGPVGEALPQPLIVKVLGAGDEPAVGREVAFELSDAAGGIVDPPTATTNSQGEAVAHWTFGTTPGSYKVVARLVGHEQEEGKTAEFIAAAIPGAPDTLTPQIPLAQPGGRQQPVKDAPTVRVVDRFGNPVPDIPVAWQVIAGEGGVTAPITMTDAEGEATVEWTLGNRIGVHKLTAAIERATGSPATFTATVFF